MLMLTAMCFVAMHVLAHASVQHPTISGLIGCRNFAPEWACVSLGYIDPNIRSALPVVNIFAAEPGTQGMSQVPHGHPHGGAGTWALLLPLLLCAILVTHSACVTVKFALRHRPPLPSLPRFSSQARRLNMGLGRPQDPLRDTTSRLTSFRQVRRRPPRYGNGRPFVYLVMLTHLARLYHTIAEGKLKVKTQ